MWLRIGVTILTVMAGWKLRQTAPEMKRPFRIPWGRAGMIYVVGAPLLMSVVALAGSDPFARRWGPVAVLLGPVAYFALRKVKSMAGAAEKRSALLRIAGKCHRAKNYVRHTRGFEYKPRS